MEAIFHEQQEGSLCAQHCLNSLLQGQFYSAVDLAELASELDTMERMRMAEMGEDSAEYQRFIQQSSNNMDDSGFFSVQVISRALAVWDLELVPFNSDNPAAVRAKASAITANAYICNYREHWFTIRRLGTQWFNLNSLLEGPELLSNSYLGLFLAQLQQEGYDIFLVTGVLPECDADLVLQAVPAVQMAPPRLLSDDHRSKTRTREVQETTRMEFGASSTPATDEAAELEAAMLMSLAETSGSDGGPANIDPNELARVMDMHRSGNIAYEENQDELNLALNLSAQEIDNNKTSITSEEDDIQKAIAMSLEGDIKIVPGSSANVKEDSGWGQRLKQQEEEDINRYKTNEEEEKALEEEQLRKALAMSMDIEEDSMGKQPSQLIKPAVLKEEVNACKTSGSTQKMKKSETSSESSVNSKISPSKANKSDIGGTKKSPPGSTSNPLMMPEGPGHKLGGITSTRNSGLPRSSSSNQSRTDDPEEIRRRRMAFLDKLQKSPPSEKQS